MNPVGSESMAAANSMLDLFACNCATCSCLLYSARHKGDPRLRELSHPAVFVAGRVWDRPYCAECLPVLRAADPGSVVVRAARRAKKKVAVAG